MNIERIVKLLNNYDGIVTIHKDDFKMPLFNVKFYENNDTFLGEIIEVKRNNEIVTYIKLSDIKTVTIDGIIKLK